MAQVFAAGAPRDLAEQRPMDSGRLGLRHRHLVASPPPQKGKGVFGQPSSSHATMPRSSTTFRVARMRRAVGAPQSWTTPGNPPHGTQHSHGAGKQRSRARCRWPHGAPPNARRKHRRQGGACEGVGMMEVVMQNSLHPIIPRATLDRSACAKKFCGLRHPIQKQCYSSGLRRGG